MSPPCYQVIVELRQPHGWGVRHNVVTLPLVTIMRDDLPALLRPLRDSRPRERGNPVERDDAPNPVQVAAGKWRWQKRLATDPELAARIAASKARRRKRPRWGSPEHLDNLREKSSVTSRKRWADPAYRARVGEAISAALRERTPYPTDKQLRRWARSDAIRTGAYVPDASMRAERISAAKRGKPKSPEHRAKLSAALRAKFPNPTPAQLKRWARHAAKRAATREAVE